MYIYIYVYIYIYISSTHQTIALVLSQVRDNDEVLETEARWRHGRVSGAFIRTDMGLSLEKNDKRWGHVNMWRNLY